MKLLGIVSCLCILLQVIYGQDTGRNVGVIQTAQAGQYLQGIQVLIILMRSKQNILMNIPCEYSLSIE